ncbi:MAG: two-component regulator propeller domain-containing protein [Chitinophagaceae bacterium]
MVWHTNGLVRYDGYQVKVYNLQTADKKEREYRSIPSLFEDSKGNIWVGTYGEGLFRFNRAADNFTRFAHPEKESGSKRRVCLQSPKMQRGIFGPHQK